MADREPAAVVTREQVLAFRWAAHQLGRTRGTVADTALLDYGVQDTGPRGARWALANRGLIGYDDADVLLAWTIRVSPHLYRRADARAIAIATSPFDDTDAAKRIFDASKPLREAGVPVLEALATVAGHERDIVARPDGQGRPVDRADPAARRALRALVQPVPGDARLGGAVPHRRPPGRARARPRDLASGAAPHQGWPAADVQAVRRRGRAPVRRGAQLPPVLRPRAGHRRGEVPRLAPQRGARPLARRRRGRGGQRPAGRPRALVGAGRRPAGPARRRARSPASAGDVRLLGPYDAWVQLRDRETLVPDQAGPRTSGEPSAGRARWRWAASSSAPGGRRRRAAS